MEKTEYMTVDGSAQPSVPELPAPRNLTERIDRQLRRNTKQVSDVSTATVAQLVTLLSKYARMGIHSAAEYVSAVSTIVEKRIMITVRESSNRIQETILLPLYESWREFIRADHMTPWQKQRLIQNRKMEEETRHFQERSPKIDQELYAYSDAELEQLRPELHVWITCLENLLAFRKRQNKKEEPKNPQESTQKIVVSTRRKGGTPWMRLFKGRAS